MKKSPVLIDYVRYCTISPFEIDSDYSELNYSFRREFLLDDSDAAIVVYICMGNRRRGSDHPAGLRRNLKFTLTDTDTNAIVATRIVPVRMTKTESFVDLYIPFLTHEVSFVNGHSYSLQIYDGEEVVFADTIRTFFRNRMVEQAKWYGVTSGGVRLDECSSTIYRSVKAEQQQKVYIRFYLYSDIFTDNFPELELRLHHPHYADPSVWFVKPKRCPDEPERLYVDAYFHAFDWKYEGPLYAEVICMYKAIGGFVFSTRGPQVEAQWYGEDIFPLPEYSHEAAQERFSKWNAEISDDFSADEFDRMLDRFIQSQQDFKPLSGEEIDQMLSSISETKEQEEKPEPSPLEALDSLTGLAAVKEKITRYEKLVRFNRMRTESHLPVASLPLHAMFLGSPGTGKTTVAKLMGQMLKRAGVLSSGHVVVRERASLLGQYYSSESENTLKALEEAQGGILFIDEAYQLCQPDDPKDPGKFVIDSLLTALADDSKRDWMLILAGYSEPMQRLFDLNPGFKSRIPESNVYAFDDFTEPELMEIASRYFESYNYTLTPEARTALQERLHHDYAGRDASFGNARHVMNLIQTDILPAMAVRVIDQQASLTEITSADIPAPRIDSTSPRRRLGFR